MKVSLFVSRPRCFPNTILIALALVVGKARFPLFMFLEELRIFVLVIRKNLIVILDLWLACIEFRIFNN